MDDQIAKLDYTSPGFDMAYMMMLNQIHDEIDDATLKHELVIVARTLGKEDIALAIQPNRIGVEGKIAYCINRGAKLAPKSIERIRNMLEVADTSVNDVDVDWEPIKDNIQAKTIRAYVDCYSQLDNAKSRVINGKLSIRELAAEVRKIVTDRGLGKGTISKQLADHYKDAFIEARSSESTAEWVKPLGVIAETLGMIISNRASISAGIRGAKARKMNSKLGTTDRKGEKAASKVSFKDEDLNLGIRSIDPTNIVGAEAVVIFNTKTRHCEVYRANDGETLSIQGAKIVNFNELKSGGKTVRKPDVDLHHWVRATTLKRLEVLMSGIKGKKWEVSGKLNKNCMIIKVM